MKLIPNAHKWWQMHSVRALAFIGAVQSVLLVVPPSKLALPILSGHAFTWGDFGFAMTVAAAVIGAIGRLIAQPKVSE
jgi:hypothetical protein